MITITELVFIYINQNITITELVFIYINQNKSKNVHRCVEYLAHLPIYLHGSLQCHAQLTYEPVPKGAWRGPSIFWS